MILMLVSLLIVCLVPFSTRGLASFTNVEPYSPKVQEYSNVVEEKEEPPQKKPKKDPISQVSSATVSAKGFDYDPNQDSVSEEEALNFLRGIYEGGRG